MTRGKKKFKKVKCFNCGGPHFAKKCNQKKKNRHDDKGRQGNEHHVLYSAMTVSDQSDVWYVDSGATSHMTRNDTHLDNVREMSSDRSITVADNSKISVKATGDILKCVKTIDGENKIIIKNC